MCITALANADPLSVNQNITFNEVGGLMIICFISSTSPCWLMGFLLDLHAQKETILLPLLYLEVFQCFDVTPTRRFCDLY